MERHGIDAFGAIAERDALDDVATLEILGDELVKLPDRDKRGNGLLDDGLERVTQGIASLGHALDHVPIAIKEHLDEAIDVNRTAAQMRTLCLSVTKLISHLRRRGILAITSRTSPIITAAELLFGDPFLALEQIDSGNHLCFLST